MTSRATVRLPVLASFGVFAALVAASAWQRSLAQDAGASIELIDPKVFRVCADPHNMPLSTEGGEGFENKIAELIARKLGRSIAYTWYPGSPGFVRNTLSSFRCDVIMGMPQGNDVVQVTNPYYHTAYALVVKSGSELAGVDELTDAKLKSRHIGVVAGTPPATYMARNGLLASAKPYPLVVDTRVDSSAISMIQDLAKGDIDAAVLWGPMAGYHAAHASPPLSVMPLVKEKEQGGPRLAYYIGMGVRHTDQEWKRILNRAIQESQAEINDILLSFGVPLLDDKDRPLQKAPSK